MQADLSFIRIVLAAGQRIDLGNQNGSRETRQKAREGGALPRRQDPWVPPSASLTVWVNFRKITSFILKFVYSCLQSTGLSTDRC